jgi:hypothetical protein
MIHMRVVQDNETVADLPKWDGPVPRRGDYLFHPGPEGTHPQDGGASTMNAIAGHVKMVTWHLYERRDGKFVKSSAPYVEITI